MDKGQVAINSDTFHFVPNASNLLEKTHNAIEPIGDQRIVLDVWTRDEIGIQIGAAFIEDLVVDDLERVVDVISVHRSAFSFGLWIRGVPLFGKWRVCNDVRKGGGLTFSVLKPLAERLDLLLRVGREQMFDCHVRRRDENRFRVRESVKTGLTVVVADARVSNSPEGHGLYKQMNVHLIDRAAAKGQAREEMINCFLVTAEEETGQRLWMLFHFTNGGIHVFVGKDWENRAKDFVLHNRVVPCDRIQDRGIEVARLAVGRTAGYNLALIN